MTKRTHELYNSACNNQRFLKEIYDSDAQNKPGLFADTPTKVFFASIYYGWLIAKYGIGWQIEMKRFI